MAVNARWTNCPAYIAIKDLPDEHEDRKAFGPFSYTLSMALAGCTFPEKERELYNEYDDSPWAITEDNWKEVFIRISIWEHLWGALRVGWEEDTEEMVDIARPTVDVYFTPEEIISMIGMSVNAGTSTKEEYRERVYLEMERKAQDKLRTYLREQNDGDDQL